jgi:hypothetical protein
MAGESQAQKLAALDQRLSRVDALLGERSDRFDDAINELKSAVKDIERELWLLREQLAALNEKCTGLQRLSDRGWALWQTLLVLAISIAASAVTQFALRK